MRFEYQFAVARKPEEVWAFFWDLSHLVRCIPGCREATMIEEKARYKTLVSEQVGPFRVEFDLEVFVKEVEEPTRIHAMADGKDNHTRSRVHVDLDVKLEPIDEGKIAVQMRTEVTLFGKLASLGHGIIRHKAQEVMKQFAEAVRAELEEGKRES